VYLFFPQVRVPAFVASCSPVFPLRPFCFRHPLTVSVLARTMSFPGASAASCSSSPNPRKTLRSPQTLHRVDALAFVRVIAASQCACNVGLFLPLPLFVFRSHRRESAPISLPSCPPSRGPLGFDFQGSFFLTVVLFLADFLLFLGSLLVISLPFSPRAFFPPFTNVLWLSGDR